jgi:hypothetical protein
VCQGIADIDCLQPFAPPNSATPYGYANPAVKPAVKATVKATVEPTVERLGALAAQACFGEACQVRVTASWAEDDPPLLQALAPTFPRVGGAQRELSTG